MIGMKKVCKIKLSVHNPSALLCNYILSKCQLLKQANCVKMMGGKLKKWIFNKGFKKTSENEEKGKSKSNGSERILFLA